MATINIDVLRAYEEKNSITGRKHPESDLYIWNYTVKSSLAREWDDITKQTRGLITTGDGSIVARPFQKFFNIGEYESYGKELPNEPFSVTEKEDGSLGILYFLNGKPTIATRGSFTSEQAIIANTILQKKYASYQFDPMYTYLFEIIYKQNRIVVDYGDLEDLILIAMIETETGNEVSIHTKERVFPFPVVSSYDGITDYMQLKRFEEKNKEGFVLRFESGIRVKVKFEEYERLFKIMTGTTARSIWNRMRSGTSLNALLESVPEEFEQWVKKISSDLGQRYSSLFRRVLEAYEKATREVSIETPKVLSEKSMLSVQDVDMIVSILQKKIKQACATYPEFESILLTLYSHRGSRESSRAKLKEWCWEQLYPQHERPFLNSEEEE